jgi:hypothetical protein
MQLDVAPIPRLTIVPLRQMGQALFYPPNVRGWVGGRQWINSATINARRQFVESLFAPIDENALNADEQVELVAARSNGIERFTVSDISLEPLAKLEPESAAAHLAGNLLPGVSADHIREKLQQFIVSGGGYTQRLQGIPSGKDLAQELAAMNGDQLRIQRLRRAAASLLQLPEYQLC